jgi:hypothetical protein
VDARKIRMTMTMTMTICIMGTMGTTTCIPTGASTRTVPCTHSRMSA